MPPHTLQRYDEPSVSAVWPIALPAFAHPSSMLHQGAGDPPLYRSYCSESYMSIGCCSPEGYSTRYT